MKVIFKDTQEVKDVKFGYAVHHLIPKGLAVLATNEKLKQLAVEAQQNQERLDQDAARAEKFLSLISGKMVKISLKGKGKKLFGSLTKAGIKRELEILVKGALPPKLEIILPKPIKAIGMHQVGLKIGTASAKVKVKVIKS